MKLKKLAPWNWFKKEHDENACRVPIKRNQYKSLERKDVDSMGQLHREMDQFFGRFFSDFGISPFRSDLDMLGGMPGGMLKPRLDLGATDKQYTVSVEIPGVTREDIRLELADDTLYIRGEKKQKTEEKQKNYYRLERSFGAFQRTLCLPEDADSVNLEARFKNGLLDITIPRLPLSDSRAKTIEVKAA